MATKYVEVARKDVLRFFGVTDATHHCIWTSGTSDALTLLRTLYFETVKRKRIKTRLLVIDDVHNSVNGLRTIAQDPALSGLVEVCFVPLDIVTLRVDEQTFEVSMLLFLAIWLAEPFAQCEIIRLRPEEQGLVLFTAQSNVSGVQQNFRTLLKRAKHHGWDTMLDAAAYVPLSQLDLAECD